MGRIQTGSYKKDGKTVYTTDVIADRVEFLGSKERTPKNPETTFEDYGSFSAVTESVPF